MDMRKHYSLVPIIKLGIIVVVAFIVIGAFMSVGKPTAPAPPPNPVDTALDGCEAWTRSHSKLTVNEIVNSYRITGTRKVDFSKADAPIVRVKIPQGHIRVGLDYRAGASGLMMHSSCEYIDSGKVMVLVFAKAGL